MFLYSWEMCICGMHFSFQKMLSKKFVKSHGAQYVVQQQQPWRKSDGIPSLQKRKRSSLSSNLNQRNDYNHSKLKMKWISLCYSLFYDELSLTAGGKATIFIQLSRDNSKWPMPWSCLKVEFCKTGNHRSNAHFSRVQKHIDNQKIDIFSRNYKRLL